MDHRITGILDKFWKILEFYKDGLLQKRHQILGSMREGSFSASYFKTNSNVPPIDLDLCFKGTRYINREHRFFIKESNKTGFVRIMINSKEDQTYFKRFLKGFTKNDIFEQIIDKHFMKCNQLKKILQDSKMMKSRRYELIIAIILNIPLRKIKIHENRRVTKSSTEQTNEIYVNDVLKAILHIDLPILIPLDWPCTYVEVWQKRQRKWPDLDLLSEEMKISYLIAKTSREEKNNINATEFQYSFAHIEQKIMALLSTNQRTLFYTAKIIFKKTIQPLSEVYFPSFLVKNTMFWICEQTPPDDPLWDFIFDEEFLTSLGYFFKKLMGYFRDGFLPYYFIPDNNLIDGLPEELSEKVLRILESLNANITNYIPGDDKTDAAKEWMNSIIFVQNRFIDFFKTVKSYGFSIALFTHSKIALNSLTLEKREELYKFLCYWQN